MTQTADEHAPAIASNLALWNEWADVNARSEFYDVEGFRAGKNRLHALEIAELGDVHGKTLLHLQCHFGLDTLSWALRGAKVTGVDFSDRAIEIARSLSAEKDIPARFVCCNLYDLPSHLEDKFDIVFTSYGAIYWLPDIHRWARIAGHFLKPGGTFYMAEFHPTSHIFDDERSDGELRVVYPYFHRPEGQTFPVKGSYADRSAAVQSTLEHAWDHPIGSIVTALADAGLRIQFLHEHAFSVFPIYPWMVRCDDGYWRLPKQAESVPLMFSLCAVREEPES